MSVDVFCCVFTLNECLWYHRGRKGGMGALNPWILKSEIFLLISNKCFLRMIAFCEVLWNRLLKQVFVQLRWARVVHLNLIFCVVSPRLYNYSTGQTFLTFRAFRTEKFKKSQYKHNGKIPKFWLKYSRALFAFMYVNFGLSCNLFLRFCKLNIPSNVCMLLLQLIILIMKYSCLVLWIKCLLW